jgi:hypothetical protein
MPGKAVYLIPLADLIAQLESRTGRHAQGEIQLLIRASLLVVDGIGLLHRAVVTQVEHSSYRIREHG